MKFNTVETITNLIRWNDHS